MTSSPSFVPGSSMLAVGLMSGTSLDGIDAAVVETDGKDGIRTLGAKTVPYAPAMQERLRAVLGSEARSAAIEALERDLTLYHARIVDALLTGEGIPAARVGVVGFHGHTLFHRPERRLTRQLGDGAWLAARLGIDVVNDFRSADVAAGGQGAPLVPLYHAALARDLAASPSGRVSLTATAAGLPVEASAALARAEEGGVRIDGLRVKAASAELSATSTMRRWAARSIRSST